jgi:hypothetical protein
MIFYSEFLYFLMKVCAIRGQKTQSFSSNNLRPQSALISEICGKNIAFTFAKICAIRGQKTQSFSSNNLRPQSALISEICGKNIAFTIRENLRHSRPTHAKIFIK